MNGTLYQAKERSGLSRMLRFRKLQRVTVGQTQLVGYKADYFFYRADQQ